MHPYSASSVHSSKSARTKSTRRHHVCHVGRPPPRPPPRPSDRPPTPGRTRRVAVSRHSIPCFRSLGTTGDRPAPPRIGSGSPLRRAGPLGCRIAGCVLDRDGLPRSASAASPPGGSTTHRPGWGGPCARTTQRAVGCATATSAHGSSCWHEEGPPGPAQHRSRSVCTVPTLRADELPVLPLRRGGCIAAQFCCAPAGRLFRGWCCCPPGAGPRPRPARAWLLYRRLGFVDCCATTVSSANPRPSLCLLGGALPLPSATDSIHPAATARKPRARPSTPDADTYTGPDAGGQTCAAGQAAPDLEPPPATTRCTMSRVLYPTRRTVSGSGVSPVAARVLFPFLLVAFAALLGVLHAGARRARPSRATTRVPENRDRPAGVPAPAVSVSGAAGWSAGPVTPYQDLPYVEVSGSVPRARFDQ